MGNNKVSEIVNLALATTTPIWYLYKETNYEKK